MADQSISQLPVATALTGNELAVIVQQGITKQTQVQDIANVSNLAALQNVTTSELNDPASYVNTVGKVPGRIVWDITNQLIAVAVDAQPTSAWDLYATSGYSGYSGFSGLNGGRDGDSGYSGYSGYSGLNGLATASGYSGYSGYSGTGTSGYSGYSGYSGFYGQSGYSGFSGIGIDGASGFSGYSGYSGIGNGGSVTSVSGTGTVNGINLSGTVTTSGNLTLGGTLDLSSPPAIGDTTPAAVKGTVITATQYYVGINGGGF